MLCHAYAPGAAQPPELFARWTWVRELGLSWDDLGGLDYGEIGLLTEMVNIKRQAEQVKMSVASTARGRR